MEKITVNAEDLRKLINEVVQIKEMLISEREEMEEIELTDWAKEELDSARKRKTKIPNEEAKKMLLEK